MATIIPNTFTSYELTDTEALQGAIFTITQIQALQNQLSAIAEEKLNMEFDPEAAQLFMQNEAYKRGQMELLQFLIDNSKAAEEELNAPIQM